LAGLCNHPLLPKHCERSGLALGSQDSPQPRVPCPDRERGHHFPNRRRRRSSR
jgi:hypothetical protein